MHVESKPSICFVALNAYNVLSNSGAVCHIGGAEVQQALIARELVDRGYCVYFITKDHGQDDDTVVNGIRILKAYKSSAGLPVLRFFYPRITALWRAMEKADADIYYQRTSDSVTGIVASFCRWKHRKFIYGVAHDEDCKKSRSHRPLQERVLYRCGLSIADRIVAQTVVQQRLLRDNFGFRSMLIRSAGRDYGVSPRDGGLETADRPHLLWLGRFAREKRLEFLLDVAEQCGEVDFDIVGDGNSENDYVHGMRLRASLIPNVYLHGWVPHSQTAPFFRRAMGIVCTSESEGFPNTFLEAWSRGLPVISTFDPDHLVEKEELGIIAGDVDSFVAAIRGLLGSHGSWQVLSHNSRRYYSENHMIQSTVQRFEELLMDVVGA